MDGRRSGIGALGYIYFFSFIYILFKIPKEFFCFLKARAAIGWHIRSFIIFIF